MKLVILAVALFVCATSATRLGLPRLPLSVLLRGNVPLIDLDNKIVGGIIVPQNAIPFQLSVQRRSTTGGSFSQSCGASIISETKALCAAHCVAANLNNVRVVAGEHSLKNVTGKEQILTIKSWVEHPNYTSPKTYSNDFSVITFNEKIKFDENAKPITLADECPGGIPAGLKEGDNLIVSGWGTTSSGGFISDVLRAVFTPYIPWKVCNQNSHYVNEIDESMICAGAAEGGVDSCQGDSGGPLYQNVTETSSKPLTQYGVVSWGYGCAAKDTPGVYSNVCLARKWIDAEMAKP